MNGIKVIQSNTVPQTFWLFTRGLAQKMREKGFELTAITSPGEFAELMKERDRIRVHSIPMTREITPAQDLWALVRCLMVIFKEKPTIIHGSTLKAGLITLLAAALTRVPARMYFMRGAMFNQMDGYNVLHKNLDRLICLCAHKVLCISTHVMDTAIEHNICSRSKLSVLHKGSSHGICPEEFDPQKYSQEDKDLTRKEIGIPADAKTIMFVGRIVKDKGVIELAEAWKDIRIKRQDVHLILVGPPEKEDPVSEEILAVLENDERVHFTGFVDEIGRYYAIADIVAVPTHREGFGNFAIEASAMKVPVVGTKGTGCEDSVVDGETGILVPLKDSVALAEALMRLLEDPALMARMGEAGRERILRDFRTDDVWEALCQEYISLLRDRGLPLP